MNDVKHYSYHALGNGIDDFHENIFWMEKCKNISHPEWEMTFRVARLAEEIHLGEVRRVSGMPYITHPIEIVLEYINQKRYPNWKSIIVLLLHDTLESHPERWQEILDIVPLDIFFRILKLSQLSEEIRGEIKDFLFDKLIAAPEDDIPILTTLILDMLTHNPERKKEILDRMNPYVKGAFDLLLDSYRGHLDIYCLDLSNEKKERELDGIWHYIFFDEVDAGHKFRDTMHNLSDVNEMSPEEKERYILRRIPKLQALTFILQQYNMGDKIAQLKSRWQEIGGRFDQLGNFVIHNQLHQIMDRVSSQVIGI